VLAFTVVWIVSIAAAIAVGSRLTWWLIWRLLLFVPLLAEIVFFSPLGSAGRLELAPGVQPVNSLISGAIILVYGVILFGPSAIALGGLGWMAVRATLLPLRVSKVSFILLGTLAGAIVGGCFDFVYDMVVFRRFPLSPDGRSYPWLVASAVGGAAGGFIVGYYASKRGGNGVNMKPRYAAALALVGWNLMTPPPGPSGNPDFSAPLSEWSHMAAFDGAATCKKEHDSEFKSAQKALMDVKNEDDLEVRDLASAVKASRCIATDDPRLRKN